MQDRPIIDDRRAVIEYRFKSFIAPTLNEADDTTIPCQIIKLPGATILVEREDLGYVRAELANLGFEFAGEPTMLRTHEQGHWYPLWREVWNQSPDMAAEAGPQEIPENLRFQPKLYRTKNLVIVLRPDGGDQKQFADYMKENLPQFKFNGKKNWWQAPISELSAAHNALKPCHVSRGAGAYLDHHS